MTVPGAFLSNLARLPDGYCEGSAGGRRYGVTVTRAPDARRQWLYAEELGGEDRISFNLYLLESGAALRPCEMPAEKVMDFVAAFQPYEAPSDPALAAVRPAPIATTDVRNHA